jgi:DNA ligase (NAD+)
MGDVLAAKLVEQVQSKRVLPLAVFLTALGVPGLGKTVAQVVAQHARTLAAARALSAADLCALPRFAEVSAEKIVSGLAARASTIDALLGVGVIVEDDPGAPAQPLSGGALSGQSFLFTGTLAQMGREDAQARVEALGGKAASGVSKALTYLVVGSEGKAGSKLDKARAAGVTVLTEPEFITLLEGAEAP